MHIALSGGGFKVVAHLGALCCLEEEGILERTETISGSSAGALVAALVLLNRKRDTHKLYTRFLKADKILTARCKNPLTGYGMAQLTLNLLDDSLRKEFGHTEATFRDVQEHSGARLLVSGFRIPDGNTVFFGSDSGTMDMKVSDAVKASTAVPPIVSPVSIGEQLYVDGAIGAFVPTHPFESEPSDSVIGISSSPSATYVPPSSRRQNTMGYAVQVIAAMMSAANRDIPHADRIVYVGCPSDADDMINLARPDIQESHSLFRSGFEEMERFLRRG